MAVRHFSRSRRNSQRWLRPCSNKTLFEKQAVSQICSTGCSLPPSGVDCASVYPRGARNLEDSFTTTPAPTGLRLSPACALCQPALSRGRPRGSQWIADPIQGPAAGSSPLPTSACDQGAELLALRKPQLEGPMPLIWWWHRRGVSRGCWGSHVASRAAGRPPKHTATA